MNYLWNEIRLKTCSEILELYRLHVLSPVEVVKAVLSRVSSLNSKVNAFVFIDEKSALKQAAQSEQRWMTGEPQGLLDGIPGTVKDLLDVKGWPTRYGSQLPIKLSPASEDAPAVARLRGDIVKSGVRQKIKRRPAAGLSFGAPARLVIHL